MLHPPKALALVAFAALLATPAAAQSLIKERHPGLGLPTFYRPRAFEPIPTQPDELFIRLYYREKAPVRRNGKARKSTGSLATLHVLVIPKRRVESGPRRAREGEEPPIRSIENYAERELRGGWSTKFLGAGKKSKDFETHQWELRPPTSVGNRGPGLAGYAYSWSNRARIVAILGICSADDYEKMRKLWRSVGDKKKVAEPEQSKYADRKLERRYRDGGLSHPEYRKRVRQALIDDWKAEDTDNFIVVYHTRDQPLLRKVMRDIELLRLEYMKLFPPQADFDAVSTVRICADRDEYIAYGGHPRTAGYWNHAKGELVLYDAQKAEKGKRPDDTNTFIALYHEAFHQYIHYSSGELAPHSWFNEGFGDYFSGATIKNGKVRGIGVNPWRVRWIRHMVEHDLLIPWQEITGWSKEKYYSNPSLAYAQGWSMIYFLETSEEVERRPEWRKILPTYFETLKRAYRDELDRLRELESDDEARVLEAARGTARAAALEAALEGVELYEIEAAWTAFVQEL